MMSPQDHEAMMQDTVAFGAELIDLATLGREVDEMATALREVSKWLPELKKECEEMARMTSQLPGREFSVRLDKRNLEVSEQNQLQIARNTLRMSDAMVDIMGYPSKEEARTIILKLTGKPARS